MSDSLQLHGLQHTRLPCPSLSPGICSNSCPLSWWCYLTISSSAIPFSFCLQFFLASGYFPTSHLFASCGQSIRASASASVLPMYNQGWFPLRLTSLISLKIKESSPESSPELQFESIDSSVLSLLCGLPLISIHDYWKNHSFEYTDLWRQRDVSAF